MALRSPELLTCRASRLRRLPAALRAAHHTTLVVASAACGLLTAGYVRAEPPSFADREYWEDRYRRENRTYDWYQGWTGLAPALTPHMALRDRVLVLGAGTSVLSEEMAAAGYDQVWSADISEVAVEQMRNRWAELGLPADRWKAVDARDMRQVFGDGSFDVTLEKGTMDALLSGPNYEANLGAMLDEVARILTPGGRHLVISSCMPSVCLEYLERARPYWKVTVDKVHKSWVKGDKRAGPVKDLAADFVYICSKHRPSAERATGLRTPAPPTAAPQFHMPRAEV